MCITYLTNFMAATGVWISRLSIPNPNINMYQDFKELLIIDDDCCHNIICALSLKKMFRSTNLNMTCFTDSKEGLSYISQLGLSSKKTLVFLDINMPRLNGWEVLARLEQLPRSIRKQLEVYVLTASPNPRDAQRAHKSSLVKHYLPKPLSNHLHFIFEERPLELSVAWCVVFSRIYVNYKRGKQAGLLFLYTPICKTVITVWNATDCFRLTALFFAYICLSAPFIVPLCLPEGVGIPLFSAGKAYLRDKLCGR